MTTDEWIAEVRAWAASHPQVPYVPGDDDDRPGRDDDERGERDEQPDNRSDA